MMIFAKNFLLKYKLQIIYFLIRAFSLLFLFDLAPDISNQLNIAYALKTDGIYALRTFDFESQSFVFSQYYDHPPLLSIIIFILDLAVNNIVYSLFLLGLIVAVFESYLVVFLIEKYSKLNNYMLLQVILTSLYIGHLDRGTISDYLSLVIGIFLFIQILGFVMKQPLNIFGVSLAVILIPLTKYSLLPIIGCFLIIYLFVLYQDRFRYVHKHIIIFISILMAASIINYFGQFENEKVNSTRFYINFYDISKLDYFWMHFGLELDRVYKHFMWFFQRSFGIKIWYWYLGQLLGVFSLLYVLKKSKWHFSKKISFLRVAIILSLGQILFLLFLQITTGPQEGVLYGVDDKNWVYIEEARYYNYLTLIWFFVILWGIIDQRKSIVSRIFCIVLFIGFFQTVKIKSDSFRVIKLFVLSERFTEIEKLVTKNKINKFDPNFFHKESTDKNLISIFGF
jgi:hypothetical protein